MDAEQIEKSKQLYESGLTLKTIGKRFGVSDRTVNRALKQAGVTIRQSYRYASKERRQMSNASDR
jgi:DNA-binding transcriptional regulator LsrR (DeoR family)